MAEIRTEPSPRRVRVFFNDRVVADTGRATLVWEAVVPQYHFPAEDVDAAALRPTGQKRSHQDSGYAEFLDVAVGERTAERAAWRFADESPLAGLVAFRWDAMDAWYEEDEEVFVHPRDPHKRIDILPSSRHVRVVVDGVTVADSHQPRLLFETGLPTRYYLPSKDVRTELLTPTDSRTECPYKGVARYSSVTVDGTTHDDLVWSYRPPIAEAAKIDGLLCFYNEKVDLYVDGELQERPHTHWS